MVNSRRKGNRGEREALNILKSHFGGHWERKPLGIPGPDLLAPDDFPYAVEVKNEKAIRAIHLIGTPTKKLHDFWKQADAQADALDKLPLLVCKVESVWFACSEWGQWQLLTDWCEREKQRARIYKEFAC